MNPLAAIGFTDLEAAAFVLSLAGFAACAAYLVYLDWRDYR
jgi:hypothetical protein